MHLQFRRFTDDKAGAAKIAGCWAKCSDLLRFIRARAMMTFGEQENRVCTKIG